MKKLLISALALTMGVTCAFGLAACGGEGGDNQGMTDAEIANAAINNLKGLYSSNKVEETPRDYQVLGKAKVQDDLYNVTWTVSEEVAEYITVGTELDEDYKITISVTRPPVAMEYTLTASVTVGEAEASYGFAKKVPAAPNIDLGDRETTTASITFDNNQKYTEADGLLIWQENGIKVTADNYNITYSVNPMRFYAGSLVKIEYPGMKHLEIDSVTFDDSDYAGPIKTSMENANIPATITVNNGDLVIDLDYAMDVIEFIASAQVRMYALDIVAVVGGANDTEKVAVAKAMVGISQTTFFELGQLELPAESNGASLTWSVKDDTDLVSIANGKLSIDKLPEEETNVTLVAAIECGDATDTAEVVITLLPDLGSTNDGTIDHPFTTTEALAIASTLDADGYYQKDGALYRVYVKGYVVATDKFNSTYNNWEGMYIASNANGADRMQVYRFSVDGTVIKSESDLVVGSYIVVYGYLQNFRGTNPQMTYNGNTNPIAVEYEKAGSNPNAHVCNDVCPICKGCLTECSEPECATKCHGHDSGNNGENSQSNPYKASEALAIAKALASGAYTDTEVYVAGYVVATGTWSSQYNNFTNVYIADTPYETTDTALLVYRLKNESLFTSASDLELGAYVVVYSYLYNYNGTTPEVSDKASNGAPLAVDYVAPTDEVKVYYALAEVEATLVVSAAGETTLPTSKVAGVTFEWEIKEGTAATVTSNGLALNVATLPAEDATVVLTLRASSNNASDTKEVTVVIKAPNLNAREVTLDMSFATIGSTGWTNSYAAHTATFTDATVTMSRASKQTGTITDVPVLAVNNATEYVTVEVNSGTITEVEFELKQWSSKIFSDIHIEYYNGSEWVSCSNTITTPATIASTVIPAGVTQVRLAVKTTATSNTQVGLAAINLTIA